MFLTIKKIRMALYVWGYSRNSGWNITWKTNVSWPDLTKKVGLQKVKNRLRGEGGSKMFLKNRASFMNDP